MCDMPRPDILREDLYQIQWLCFRPAFSASAVSYSPPDWASTKRVRSRSLIASPLSRAPIEYKLTAPVRVRLTLDRPAVRGAHANHLLVAGVRAHRCTSSRAAAEPLRCDLSQLKPAPGLSASLSDNLLTVSWRGDGNHELRLRLTIVDARPLIRDLSVRKGTGAWAARREPRARIPRGHRRAPHDDAAGGSLRAAGIEITEDVIDKNRWYAFWDAPLEIPSATPPGGRGGGANRALGGPRTASEIRRADATFSATSCRARTDGASLEVSYPGLTLGSFAESCASRSIEAPTSYAWTRSRRRARNGWPTYDAGLGGFSTALTPRVTWRDTGGHPQQLCSAA